MSTYQVTTTTEDLKENRLKTVLVEFNDGITVEILNFGATIKTVEVPNRKGVKENIVLSYPSNKDYLTDSAYLGCTVGRYANRICKGKFLLHGTEHQLSVNDGDNHLHGGAEGFNKKIWSIDSVKEGTNSVAIELCYKSSHGEEGYPGNLEVKIEYVISKDAIEIHYRASTDQDTLFNPTNHSYFNLTGDPAKKIDDHLVRMTSKERLELRSNGIPTGQKQSVLATAYDFKSSRKIGAKKFDDCYLLDNDVVLIDEASGRSLKIKSTLPSFQLYTGDYLAAAGFKNRTGICIEPQFFPDTPNHEQFPSCILKVGQLVHHTIVYQFYTDKS